jgi:predicted enzyme related to lactoylglutathione lyase
VFAQVPEPKSTKNRVHPDLTTDDLDGELTRLKKLGATVLADHHDGDTRWAALADPEGNEFDVVAG